MKMNVLARRPVALLTERRGRDRRVGRRVRQLTLVHI